jgi:hypothetical protein
MRYAIFGLLIFCSAGLSACGCNPGCKEGEFCDPVGGICGKDSSYHPGTPGTSPSSAIIHTKIASGGTCPCDGEDVYLSNLAGKPLNVTVREAMHYRVDPCRDTVPQTSCNNHITFWKGTLAVDEDRFMGCRSDEVYGEPASCGGLTTEYTIVNQYTALEVIKGLLDRFGFRRLIDAEKSRFSLATANVSPICSELCADPDAQECIRVPNTSSGSDVVRKFAALEALVKNSGAVVRQTDVMNIFDVSEDPCARSDTSVLGNVVTNTGDRCFVHQKIDFNIGGTSVSHTIGLEIPPEVVGLINPEGNRIEFQESEKGPRLNIDWPSLQASAGGDVKSIELQQGSVFVETGSSCLKVGAN